MGIRNLLRFLAAGLMFGTLAPRTRASALFFQPTQDAMGHVSYAWSSVQDWYFTLSPLVPANRLPEAGDDVYLPEGQVTVDVTVDVNSITTVDSAIQITGSIAVTTLDTTTGGGSGTSFTGSAVTIKEGGQWNVASGVGLTGTQIIVDSGALMFVEAGTTVNAGNSILYDVGQIEMENGAEINFVNGTNQLSILPNAQFTGIGATVLNLDIQDGATILFDNNGTVQCNTGTLTIGLGNPQTTTWTNSIQPPHYTTITSNSVIQITSDYVLQPNNTNYFTGPGLILFANGGTSIINGLFQIGTTNHDPGMVEFNGNVFTGGGTVDVVSTPGIPSTLLWNGGAFSGPLVNIDSMSDFIITNNTTKIISGSVINNSGTTTWLTDNGNIQLDNGGNFNNLASGTFLAENNAQILGGAGSSSSFFNNTGTFRKTNSVGITDFDQDNAPAPSAFLINAGFVDVESGILKVAWGTNSSQIYDAAGAQTRVWKGTNAQTSAASFTGPGTFSIGNNTANFWLLGNLTVSNLDIDSTGVLDGPGNLIVADGTLNISGATTQGSGALNIAANGVLTITSNTVTMLRNVNNSGAVTNNQQTLTAKNITWNNLPGGTLTLEGASLLYSGTQPALVNAGLLLNTSNNSSVVDWATTNAGGAITVYPSSLTFQELLTQTAGTINVEPGAVLSVSLSGGTNYLVNLGGTLEGAGQISAHVFNSGIIHPGQSPGILTIGGTLTNLPGAVLAVDIGGTTAGTQYSQLNNNNSQVWIGNMGLVVTFDGGFVPTVGQTFAIIPNAQLTGTFDSIQGVHPGGGVLLTPQYTSSAATLVAAHDPSPSPPVLDGATAKISFQSTSGLTNIIQYTGMLNPANWQTLTTIIGDGTVKQVTDPSAPATNRFYRVGFK